MEEIPWGNVEWENQSTKSYAELDLFNKTKRPNKISTYAHVYGYIWLYIRGFKKTKRQETGWEKIYASYTW